MSSGWNLQSGNFIDRYISQEEIISIINYNFSNKTKKTTTYKYAFFKCLLDNLFNVDENLTLTFDKIFSSFTEIYWYLVFKHSLCQIQINTQWTQSSVEREIIKFNKKYNFNNFFEFNNLNDNLKIELIKSVGKECEKYVIGAFYEDTKRMFYSFDKKKNTIKFNPVAYQTLLRYKILFEKLNYFEWIKFLEKSNPAEKSYAIAEKLDNSTKRTSLSKYRDFLLEFHNFDSYCFYCNKNLDKSTVSVDHFIPWSFAKDDKLWNFVLSCSKCNSSKSDKLTTQVYLGNILSRNSVIISNYKNRNLIEGFSLYKESKIITMYDTAIFNGFEYDWKPTN